jgi:hypothetical protein
MNSKLSCNLGRLRRKTKTFRASCVLAPSAALLLFSVAGAPAASASSGDAPVWMHALVNVPLPAHDEKTDAVLLYSEDVLNVQPTGKIKSLERRAYKILRPAGRGYGRVEVYFDSETRITSIHGWCIPAQGKDYEVKEKDATEASYFGDVTTDLRRKILQIPASEPGNIVGYEIEHEDRPYILESDWSFQHTVPTREAHYTLQLPPGWEYRAVWLNHPEIPPAPAGSNQWQWVVSDVQAITPEEEMPPWRGMAGQMVVSLIPAGSTPQSRGFVNWGDMGSWYNGLTRGRRDASPAIKQKVAELTASYPAPLGKMQALARFLQHDIRYVAIELGIGGVQPHPAADVYAHLYGDCKDKATLLSSMLQEAGIESYYVVINTERGAVGPATPPHVGDFNHAILAVRLPEGVSDPSLVAVQKHPKLGTILFFDPTDQMTPFGKLRGPLQASYALLVTPEGGELVQVPQLPAAMSGIQRTAKLTLSPAGTLTGDVKEVNLGDYAAQKRHALTSVTKDADRIKPIETVLAHSLAAYHLTKATMLNLQVSNQPFEFDYSLVAENYAQTAGNLLMLRPRVVGNKSSALLETKEPRKYPVEFEGPTRDADTFEITLPPGYEVDDLPPPVDADYGFASYHSKTEVSGHVLRYTRTYEVKELSVPLSKVDDLKKLYRIIASDERNTAVLKPTQP